MVKFAIKYCFYSLIMFLAIKESLNFIDNTISGLIYIILIGISVYTSILVLAKDKLAYLFMKTLKEKFFEKKDKYETT